MINLFKLRVLAALVTAVISGCTSISVRPIDANLGMSHIIILKNDRVEVDEFLPVLIEGCSRNGISTSVETHRYTPSEKDFVLQYTAFRSWDFANYLTRAEIEVFQNKQQVGYAEYHLRQDGGLSFMKWQGTESKIGPVVDELLKNYKQIK